MAPAVLPAGDPGVVAVAELVVLEVVPVVPAVLLVVPVEPGPVILSAIRAFVSMNLPSGARCRQPVTSMSFTSRLLAVVV
jgi:hypothetical protein